MAGLVPCKFFSRGSCRYGDSCKFYHNRVENSGGAFGAYGGNNYSNPILSPPNFRPQQGHVQQPQQQQYNNRQQGYANKAAETLVQVEDATVKDMKEWAASKMWPLSVYAPISLKACVPGFEDYSPEELRYSWLQHDRQPPPDLLPRLHKVQEFRGFYQQPSQTTRAILERVLKDSTSEQIAAAFPIGNSSPWSTPIQVANNPQAQSVNVFNQMAQSQPQTGFLATAAPTPGGLWSQPQQTAFPVAGQQMGNPGLFGNMGGGGGGDTMDASELSSYNAGLANMQSAAANTSFLNTSVLGQQTQPQQQQPGSGFIFSLDGNNRNNALAPGIGSGTPLTSIFAQGLQQPPPQLHQQLGQLPPGTPSIFGGSSTAQVMNQPFQIQQQASSGKFVYSEESDLTDEEKASFLAPQFDIIPLKPPPKSWCF